MLINMYNSHQLIKISIFGSNIYHIQDKYIISMIMDRVLLWPSINQFLYAYKFESK